MGFRTLAIQKRSSEVWKLLGAVKKQFGQFTGILEKVEKKLHEASSNIGDASKKSRTIESRLRSVEELPTGEAERLLPELGSDDSEE
jgi:DNA recombination protein RmuC